MTKPDYEIVPNPDTVIILKNPNAKFAVWNTTDDDKGATAVIGEAAPGNATNDDTNEDAPTTDGSSQISLPNDRADEDEIRYAVSRQHLITASPVFEHMLSKDWKGGHRNEIDGFYYVNAEDWDSEAFLYLLQVIHLRNRHVPRTVSLEMLAKISVLIDYYECVEALELCTERWVEHVKVAFPVPSEICRDLMLWMCIAWVLRLQDVFKETTRVSIRHDDRDLEPLGLPITVPLGE